MRIDGITVVVGIARFGLKVVNVGARDADKS